VMEPTARADIEGHDNIIVQAVGSGINVAVGAGRPHLRLTQFVARTQRVCGDDSDTALLSAYRDDVVGLLGRDEARAEFGRWIRSKRRILIRVLTGAGGRGKTRLALELARKATEQGWLAGFATATELDRFRKQQNIAEWAWDKPVLMVVDYAASRVNQLRDWLGELVDSPIATGPPLRLLLLERQAHREIGWLAVILGHGQDDRSRAIQSLLDPPEPMELPAIDDLASRREIFETLLARRRGDLTAPELGIDPEFDRLLQHEKWSGDPLFLMMAGLVASTIGVEHALTLTRTDLATTLSLRELDRIGAIAAGAGINATDQRYPGLLARHMAVLATLAQGLSLQHARRLIVEELPTLGSSADVNSALAALRDALPRSGDGREISAIAPDVIGEAAIMAWLGDGGALPNLGLEALPSLHRVAVAARGRVSQVLVRTAQDFAAVGRDEPVKWLDALGQAAEAQADLGALMEIANELPDQTTALRELAVDLTRRIAGRLRPVATEGADGAVHARFGGYLAKLGVRLGALGRHEEALAASQEAVDIYRRLAATHPDAFLADLALSLTGFSRILSGLGHREEALTASQEAVDIRRRLAAMRPDAILPDLATSLSNLGVTLSNLGRREEGLAASQESVDIRRRLAAARPDAVLPDLAWSLNNLGAGLSNLGRPEEALVASQEAADIYRRLAATRPDAFLPDLAWSLNNLGVLISHLGRPEKALAASQEAVDIHRRLAGMRPDAFLPDLARSLNNISVGHANLGHHEESLAAIQEAVDIRRRLAAIHPEAFLPDLATSLTNQGGRLSGFGRPEEALAASQEAVDIHRRLADTRPDAFLPDLATSLNNHGIRLTDLGRPEEALAVDQEAVDIRRRLATMRPDAFALDLASSLNNLGRDLSYLGRREEALAASQEAVDICRHLAVTRPDALLPALGLTLNDLGNHLSDLGRREEALAASQEAVDIHRRLAAARPDAFVSDLATSLNNYGIRLSDLGRREEALAASQEAVDIRRRLAATRPDAFLPDLAMSISTRSEALAANDRHPEAAQAAVEALQILLPYVERYPKTYGALARTISANVLRHSEMAGHAPDQTLLEHATRVLDTSPSESHERVTRR
jgi:tetratricopeptide (TPR) repeat protein